MSLYNIADFNSSAHYFKNDIVWGGEEGKPNYYYCLIEHDAGSYTFSTEVETGTRWGGIVTINDVATPHFLWVGSYATAIRLQPKVKVIKFGDSYEQRTPDGINSSLIEIDYIFGNRDIREAQAILHFLKECGGSTMFVHTPSAPYDSQRKFVCRTWDHTFDFINNFTIRAKFDEVVA